MGSTSDRTESKMTFVDRIEDLVVEGATVYIGGINMLIEEKKYGWSRGWHVNYDIQKILGTVKLRDFVRDVCGKEVMNNCTFYPDFYAPTLNSLRRIIIALQKFSMGPEAEQAGEVVEGADSDQKSNFFEIYFELVTAGVPADCLAKLAKQSPKLSDMLFAEKIDNFVSNIPKGKVLVGSDVSYIKLSDKVFVFETGEEVTKPTLAVGTLIDVRGAHST